MYQSKIAISRKNKKALISRLDQFLSTTQKIYCRALQRKISLDKLPEAILKRKESATSRLQRLFVAFDIIKNEGNFSVRENKGCLEYEIIGKDRDGKIVYVHIREELSIQKDRILFFVSCY